MMLTIEPSGASGASWSNPSNALVEDATVATNAAGTGWLSLACTVGIESELELVSYQIRSVCGVVISGPAPLIGEEETVQLEFALSKDSGATAFGAGQIVDVYDVIEEKVLPMVEDVSEWVPDDFNASSFRILVRRSVAASEAACDRLVDSVVLDLYYNAPGGSILADRITVHQSLYFGKETTKGTSVATPKRFKTLKFEIQPKVAMKEDRGAGDKMPVGHYLMTEHSEIPYSGHPSYNEMGWVLSSVIGQPTTAALDGFPTAFRHVFNINTRTDDTVNTFTMIFGDSARCHKVVYAQLLNWSLKFQNKDAEMSGNGVAGRISDAATLPTGVAEVQTLTITGTPTGGTFKLKFRGHETAALAYNIAGAALQTALRALASIGATGLSVSGAGPYVVTFADNLLGMNVEPLELSNNAFTGGTSPSMTIAETTRGGFTEMDIHPILPGGVSVYIADTYAGLSAGRQTRVFMMDTNVTEKGNEFFALNDANESFAAIAEAPMKGIVKMLAMAGTEAMALLTAIRAGATKYIRIEALSPAAVTIDGTNRFRMAIELCTSVAEFNPYKDEGGVYAAEFTMSAKFDETQGFAYRVILENEVAAY